MHLNVLGVGIVEYCFWPLSFDNLSLKKGFGGIDRTSSDCHIHMKKSVTNSS